MAASIPYIAVLNTVLTANAQGVVQYQIATNSNFHVKSIRQQSTGTFNVVGMRTSGLDFFSNVSINTPIPNTLFQTGSSPNLGIGDLPIPLELTGGMIVFFDVKDTSAAGNTINIFLIGVMDKA